MASQILLKKSTTASAVPTTSDVAVGEIAVNTEDKRLFTKDSGGTVVELGTTPSSLNTSGTITYGSLSDGTITITAFADEDDMSSDSATLVPTQQSVKAYVDSQVASKDDLSELTGDTDDIAEGSTNLYYTDARVQAVSINNVVEDTTPQLGGDLDLNSSDITGTGNIDITGSISLTGTVDGRDVATDGTKLDGIEANADVTDTANVTAAGALMDSEVTNLAQVKAFDSADYATAAQGALADSALQAEVNDLTAAVTWANVPDANITESSVTQHEAALTITESQISDFGTYDPAGTAVAMAIALG
jgi:hypothetical protein